MSGLNTDSPAGFTSSLLIADTVHTPGGSSDSLGSFTKVGANPVSAALEIQSTLGALLVPRMTGSGANNQRDALIATNGMIIYNTSTNSFNLYEDGGWIALPAVITPTVANDIAIFTDNDGTLGDSGVRLFSSPLAPGNSNLIEGIAAGSVALNAASNNAVIYGVQLLTTATVVGDTINIGVNNAANVGTMDTSILIGTGIAASGGIANLSGIMAIGIGALAHAVDGTTGTVAIGRSALGDSPVSISTVAVGDLAGQEASGYNACTYVGFNANSSNDDVTSQSVFGAMSSGGGSRCTVLGANATIGVGITDSTAIGYNSSVTANFSMVLGASGTFVGINTTAPNAYFDNKGGYSISGQVISLALGTPYIVEDTDQYLYCKVISFPAVGTISLPTITNNNLGRRLVLINLTNPSLINLDAAAGQTVGPYSSDLSGSGFSSYTITASFDGTGYFWYTTTG